jgi:hypothetical protein
MLRRKRRITMVVGTVGVSFVGGCMVLFLGMCDGISSPTVQRRTLMIFPNLGVGEEVGVEAVVDEDAAELDEVAEVILRTLKSVLHRRLHQESATRASSHPCLVVNHPPKKQRRLQRILPQPTSFRYQRRKKLLLLAHLYRQQKGPGQSKLMLVRPYESIPFLFEFGKSYVLINI